MAKENEGVTPDVEETLNSGNETNSEGSGSSSGATDNGNGDTSDSMTSQMNTAKTFYQDFEDTKERVNEISNKFVVITDEEETSPETRIIVEESEEEYRLVTEEDLNQYKQSITTMLAQLRLALSSNNTQAALNILDNFILDEGVIG